MDEGVMSLRYYFAVLKPDLGVEPVGVTPTVYNQLDAKIDNFKAHILASTREFDSDRATWERHPAGDEIALLLSGAAKILLETNAGELPAELTESGSYIAVPRHTRRTVRVSGPTRMLFITPGEGAENRARI